MFIPKIPIPEIKTSEIVYSGYFNMRVDLLQLPHGPKRPYTVLEIGQDASAVVAETQAGKLLLAREYRHPVKRWLYGCTGGRIDAGESPLEAAKRELLEEAGYISSSWISLGSAFPFPAVTEQRIHFYIAKEAKYVQPPTLEPFELIHIIEITLEELAQEIQQGADIDGVLCTLLFLRGLSLGK